MPSVNFVLLEIEQVLRELKLDTAPGLDGVGAAFLKHAVRHYTQHQTNRAPERLLAPVLAELFLLVFQTRQIPSIGKVARLVPFHKKGNRDDPASYRLMTVNSVVYRLFASVLNSLLTKWCIRQGILPIEQFGFVPGRNCQQAQFLLRHLSQSRGGRHSKQLWLSFIDFKDNVDRRALLHHLRCVIGVSDVFLSVIQSKYDDDACILQDGCKVSGRVNPSRRVKQGCPLSPLLFALFISDMGEWMQKPDELDLPMGAPLLLDSFIGGTFNSGRVTHALFAGDLVICEL
jgi:hypothetical protein